MPLTIDPQDAGILDGGVRLKFFRDADYAPAAPLVGIREDNDAQTLLRCTPDGRLKIDASVTIDSVDIGDIDARAKNIGGLSQYLQGQPDAVIGRFALIVNDPALEQTLRGFVPIQTVFTRDADGFVISFSETDGVLTKTTTITRDSNFDVASMAEVVV